MLAYKSRSQIREGFVAGRVSTFKPQQHGFILSHLLFFRKTSLNPTMSSSPPQTPFSTTHFPDGFPREYAVPSTNNEISDESDHPEQPIEVNNEDNNDQQAEDEEEGECGFCLFMKGGGCKEAFIAWENCVQEGENNKEDIVEKCFEVTSALKKCMDAHSDYYEPILRAEKAAEEEAVKELEKEIAVKDSPSNQKQRGEPPLDSKDCEVKEVLPGK